MQLPGLPDGFVSAIGMAVSDNHKATGYLTSQTSVHAFYWSGDENNGLIRDIGTLEGGAFAYANAVNNSGQVVGYSNTATTISRAFLWQDGTGMINLGVLDGDMESVAYDISNAGQVVGYSLAPGLRRAVLWDEGDIFDLNTLLDDSGLGYHLDYAYAINHYGWILAEALDPTGARKQVLLKPLSLDDPAVVPAPGMLMVLGFAFLGLGFCRVYRTQSVQK